MIQPVQKLLVPGSHPATSSPVSQGPTRVCELTASCLPTQYRLVIASCTLQSKIRSRYFKDTTEDGPQELLVRKMEPQFFSIVIATTHICGVMVSGNLLLCSPQGTFCYCGSKTLIKETSFSSIFIAKVPLRCLVLSSWGQLYPQHFLKLPTAVKLGGVLHFS